jgi:hypothetical protein
MPNINGATEREQLAQVKSYLYQLIPQLQWALSNIGTSSTEAQVVQQVIGGKTVTRPSASAEATFNAIKSLIIKSADIVQAYYDVISTRLEGMYVAESDFGTFAEQTTQDIIKSSTDIELLFTNVQSILTDIENIDTTLIDVDAHINLGEIDKVNGVPVIGLEIGQRTKKDGEEVFNQYARFTADKLSFYDKGGHEVAYISDYKLYIRDVEIKKEGSFQMGGYKDFVGLDGGIVTRWVGGSD